MESFFVVANGFRVVNGKGQK